MKPDQSKRLDMLDGLRGLAILLVFLNHVDSKPMVNLFPGFFQPVIETFFSSGVIGVSFLFILSGFLMVYIYPKPTDNLAFLQKRYTRIFPLFVTMTLVMTVFKIMPGLNVAIRILTILSFALISHLLWVYVVQRLKWPKAGRLIFVGFLLLQITIALWYLFLMRKPPIYLNQQLPAYLREGTITLVNATLTLSFGNYVPMLDGVYWSLASEVLFYILYPTVCIPFITLLSRRSRTIMVLFFCTLFPFFSALSQMSRHILKFSILFLPLFMYFVLGMLLGYLLRNKRKSLVEFVSRFDFFGNPIFFFILIILIRQSLFYTDGTANEYVRMLWVLPLSIFMILILNEKTHMARFFSSKFLVFLGIISYSIYLCHTSIVDGLHLWFKPTGFQSNIIFIFLSFSLTVVVAGCLYYLLEKPYFARKSAIMPNEKKSFRFHFPVLSPIIIASIFVAFFIAYQSSYNFFSFEKTYGTDVVISPHLGRNVKRISVKEAKEIKIRLRSPENRFGIVTASLSHISPPGSFVLPPELVFQIKPVTSRQWYSTSKYSLAEIGESKLHPFGFPVIEEAKNKEFDIKIYLTQSKSLEDIEIKINNGILLKTINQLDKKTIVENPVDLFKLFLNRINNMIVNPEAQIAFVSLLPFVFLTVFISSGKKLSVRV